MAVDYSKIITDICKDILKLTDMFPYFIIAAVLIIRYSDGIKN